jgi:hypothetical protein
MQKYIFISSELDGYRTSEIHEISNSDLAAIRPVITAMLNATDEDRKEYTAYSLYGHLDGLNTLVKYVPEGENGAHYVVDIKLLELKEILL